MASRAHRSAERIAFEGWFGHVRTMAWTVLLAITITAAGFAVGVRQRPGAVPDGVVATSIEAILSHPDRFDNDPAGTWMFPGEGRGPGSDRAMSGVAP